MSAFQNLKMDPDHVMYHYDHAKRTQASQWTQFNTAEKMPTYSESSAPTLQRHDIFPGYVSSKPIAL